MYLKYQDWYGLQNAHSSRQIYRLSINIHHFITLDQLLLQQMLTINCRRTIHSTITIYYVWADQYIMIFVQTKTLTRANNHGKGFMTSYFDFTVSLILLIDISTFIMINKIISLPINERILICRFLSNDWQNISFIII